MKENKSYQNLQDIIENEPLEIEPIREKIKVNCSDKVEVFFNSFFGFVFLLLNGYWFQYLYNTYFKSKKL